MRTTEQRDADEALREAVQATLKAYGWDDGGVLTDFLVLGSMSTFDSEGTPESSTFTLHAEESVPIYRLLGLCEAVAARYRVDIAREDD